MGSLKPAIAPQVHIRWEVRRDMPEMAAIAKTARVPWVEEVTEEEREKGEKRPGLRNFLRQPNNVGMVVELDEKVIGYALYTLHEDESRIEVAAFEVYPAFRNMRLGLLGSKEIKTVGEHMLDRLIRKLAYKKMTILDFNVSEYDDATLALLQNHSGFKAPDKDHPVRRDYFWNGDAAYPLRCQIPGREPGLHANDNAPDTTNSIAQDGYDRGEETWTSVPLAEVRSVLAAVPRLDRAMQEDIMRRLHDRERGLG